LAQRKKTLFKLRFELHPYPPKTARRSNRQYSGCAGRGRIALDRAYRV